MLRVSVNARDSEGRSLSEGWIKTRGCYFIIIIMYN